MSKKSLIILVTIILIATSFSAASKSISGMEEDLLSSNVVALTSAGQVICSWNPYSICYRNDEWGFEVWPHYIAVEPGPSGHED